jgi:hypothetical protein
MTGHAGHATGGGPSCKTARAGPHPFPGRAHDLAVGTGYTRKRASGIEGNGARGAAAPLAR